MRSLCQGLTDPACQEFQKCSAQLISGKMRTRLYWVQLSTQQWTATAVRFCRKLFRDGEWDRKWHAPGVQPLQARHHHQISWNYTKSNFNLENLYKSWKQESWPWSLQIRFPFKPPNEWPNYVKPKDKTDKLQHILFIREICRRCVSKAVSGILRVIPWFLHPKHRVRVVA